MTGKKFVHNSVKVYKGVTVEFTRKEEYLGHGGNGGVYDIDIVNNNIYDFPVVAKFFEYDNNQHEKQKRYGRFKKEIQTVQNCQAEIPGIIKIIDNRCPEQVPKDKDEAWYLMPKAVEYRINNSSNLAKKLEDMLELANTISMLHKRGLAHRDIKPENILLLNGKVVLSDFGLVWTVGQERITDPGDRLGPYKILPPEFEELDSEELAFSVDYRPSDVYLFAKVLWMYIRKNNAGFRGQYNRGDIQIYLDREIYNVKTLEPLHCLIEGATNNNMSKRITISQCIEYLIIQIRVCNGQANNEIKKLCFDEVQKEFINRAVPSERVFEDKKVIYNYLDSIIKYSKVYVRGVDDNLKEILVSKLNVMSNGKATFIFFYEGRKVTEYLFKAKRLIFIEGEHKKIILTTSEISDYDSEYVKYNEFQFGNLNKKIVLNEEFILEIYANNI